MRKAISGPARCTADRRTKYAGPTASQRPVVAATTGPKSFQSPAKNRQIPSAIWVMLASRNASGPASSRKPVGSRTARRMPAARAGVSGPM